MQIRQSCGTLESVETLYQYIRTSVLTSHQQEKDMSAEHQECTRPYLYYKHILADARNIVSAGNSSEGVPLSMSEAGAANGALFRNMHIMSMVARWM